jgi:hypothetical protein
MTSMKRLLLIALLGTSALTSQSPSPTIREEQSVIVNGASETWRLEWKTPLKSACGAEDVYWYTCPCAGFAYGEAGGADLVQISNGREIDRLSLTALFDENLSNVGKLAILPRWEPQDGDIKLEGTEELLQRVRSRPVVKVMQFGDYDHDGNASEFFLQTGTAPCGKLTGVVVGRFRGSTGLSALGTALHPSEPLVMKKDEWEALRDATGPIRVVDWTCGDHGSDTEIELELSTGAQGISVTSRTFACDDNNGRRVRLLNEEPQ